MRPTFDGLETGRGCHCLPKVPRRTFCPRHPAIEPGATWGVGHGTGNGHSTRGGSGRRIPGPVHEPNNWTSANRPGDRRGGSSHPNSSASCSPSVIGGRSRFSVPVGPDQALRVVVRCSVLGWTRRATLRRSRSAWMTRAALTRSGSWLTVPATQVDVGRLEGRDLAQGVVVELAERDDRGLGHLERGRRRAPEVADSIADEGAGRCRRAQRLAPDDVGMLRWLPAQGRPARRVADGLVAWLVDAAHVDTTRHRARGLGWRGPTVAPHDAGFERGVVGPRSPAVARSAAIASQRRVGIVDLGHPACRQARGGGVVAREVRVIRPGETAPGRLDLGR